MKAKVEKEDKSSPKSSAEDEKKPKGSKKIKVSRACNHCQRSHLTCDEGRPCDRCVKRNLASTCEDGVRKKAKYLRQDEEPMQSTYNISPITVALPPLAPITPAITHPQSPIAHPIQPPNTAVDLVPPFEAPINDDFGSATMGLEYSYLSTMLLDPAFQLGGHETTSYGLPELGASHLHHTNDNRFNPAVTKSSDGGPFLTSAPTPAELNYMVDINNAVQQQQQRPSLPQSLHPIQSRTHEVYASVTRPYDYREGYRYLSKYVKERMKKPDMMRIVRAMARFRPSFLSQISALSEEDLIFMEKCFQRNLLECEKASDTVNSLVPVFADLPNSNNLILISARVIIRHTNSDVALVGKEFCLLTQWTREQLLSKKTYIYELMDSKSAVDYWEKFTLIAFDNSQQSIMSKCTLLTPLGLPVPCTFCFTIKKDPFDLPLVVIGNFLPVF
ncbi:hypothetical protein SmJEL517_g01544 [Synchytrium microbalum]|uniref:Zn(2)-C6 fungal-type domain-containing protein n=1 Tax=Synchytrium microbalum TaxID=1806994 RepID=A0A507CAM3_9FUNG|nr:uncharacterized protein SmJEL517_g01544 [Synchytrium microbalum]TPX36229.1 hypothetical protein SmJEL517_g01544 [Synchytrium microbalum]